MKFVETRLENGKGQKPQIEFICCDHILKAWPALSGANGQSALIKTVIKACHFVVVSNTFPSISVCLVYFVAKDVWNHTLEWHLVEHFEHKHTQTHPRHIGKMVSFVHKSDNNGTSDGVTFVFIFFFFCALSFQRQRPHTIQGGVGRVRSSRSRIRLPFVWRTHTHEGLGSFAWSDLFCVLNIVFCE